MSNRKAKALTDENLKNAAGGFAEIFKDTDGNILGADFYDDKTFDKVGGKLFFNKGATLKDVKEAADMYGVSDKGAITTIEGIEGYKGYQDNKNK